LSQKIKTREGQAAERPSTLRVCYQKWNFSLCTMNGVSRINVTQRLAHRLPQSNVKVRVGKSLVTSSKSGSGDFQVHDFVRQHIVDLEPYTPILPFEVLSEKLGLPCDKIVKLDANENPYGPPPEVYTALQNLQYPHIYPDPESRQLRAALAVECGVPAENLLIGCGADEVIFHYVHASHSRELFFTSFIHS